MIYQPSILINANLELCQADQGPEYALPEMDIKIAITQKEKEWEALKGKAQRLLDGKNVF
jgi:ABC-type transporter Mla subunit MlaD